jgi:hypothetical protein
MKDTSFGGSESDDSPKSSPIPSPSSKPEKSSEIPECSTTVPAETKEKAKEEDNSEGGMDLAYTKLLS